MKKGTATKESKTTKVNATKSIMTEATALTSSDNINNDH